MVDIHTHVMANVDDGANSKQESINMLKEAEKAGFTDVVLTPHYIEDYFDSDLHTRNFKLRVLQDFIRTQVFINISLGAEVFVSEKMGKWIKEGKITTINNSRYLLFELPTNSKIVYLENIIDEILNLGYTPILAHPERYKYVQKDTTFVEKLAKKGVLFQSNFGSIIGQYGKEAEETIKKLLKENRIQFLATDAHRDNSIYTHMDKILKKLERIVGKEILYNLTTVNPGKVLKNEEIEITQPKERVFFTKKVV